MLEQQWGKINYTVIWPIAKQIDQERHEPQGRDENETVPAPVRVHRMIGAMNLEILKAAPANYARWLALAIRRAAWGTAANITMHPIFLAAILIGAVRVLKRAFDPRPWSAVSIPAGWPAFAAVAISYAIFNIGFIIWTSPPIGRFADAGAIFLPALAGSLLAEHITQKP